MPTRTRPLFLCGIAALALASVPANPGAVEAATRQVVALSGPRVSVVDAARTVVTFEAKGDIRGMLTIQLVRDAAGGDAALTGEWALVSRYVRDLATENGDLGRGAEDSGYADNDKLGFVNRGTLYGSVAGGRLEFADNGQLEGASLRLVVAGGFLEFEGMSGMASASVSNLQDVNQGSGTFVLGSEVSR